MPTLVAFRFRDGSVAVYLRLEAADGQSVRYVEVTVEDCNYATIDE